MALVPIYNSDGTFSGQYEAQEVSDFGSSEATNLFFWGTPDGSASTYAGGATVRLDAQDYMELGSGRYVHISDFPVTSHVVNGDFTSFAPSDGSAYVDLPLSDVRGGVPNIINLNNGRMDIGSADYARRAYADGNIRYEINEQSSTVRVFADGSAQFISYEIRPIDDNFDFDGGSTTSNVFNNFYGPTIETHAGIPPGH